MILALLALAALPGPHAQARTSGAERLLLQRVAELQRRVPKHRSYLGADSRNRLHLRRGTFWTQGFLGGALWQAARLQGGRSKFVRPALSQTLANLGHEQVDTHDQGFIYEPTSVTAYRRLCRGDKSTRRCRRLRRSGLAAARTLVRLADGNRVAGTIPTRSAEPSPREADTIIDSLMNLPLLYWASRETADPKFRRVAARHVTRVRKELLRTDGSTYQSVHFDRASGRVLKRHTHQGMSAQSTWARGQGWAVYGFSASAQALHSPSLLAAAESAAGWVASHLPPSAIPRWDYSAGPHSASDVSAGAITAAGLYRLAALCRRRPCEHASRWRPLADAMLRAVLRRVSRKRPLGYLGGSAGTYARGPTWDDNAEMVYALYYTLEAINLRRESRRH